VQISFTLLECFSDAAQVKSGSAWTFVALPLGYSITEGRQSTFKAP